MSPIPVRTGPERRCMRSTRTSVPLCHARTCHRCAQPSANKGTQDQHPAICGGIVRFTGNDRGAPRRMRVVRACGYAGGRSHRPRADGRLRLWEEVWRRHRRVRLPPPPDEEQRGDGYAQRNGRRRRERDADHGADVHAVIAAVLASFRLCARHTGGGGRRALACVSLIFRRARCVRGQWQLRPRRGRQRRRGWGWGGGTGAGGGCPGCGRCGSWGRRWGRSWSRERRGELQRRNVVCLQERRPFLHSTQHTQHTPCPRVRTRPVQHNWL